jgi:hypothetical protein
MHRPGTSTVTIVCCALVVASLLGLLVAAPPASSPPAKPPQGTLSQPEAVAAVKRFDQAEQQAGRQFTQALDQARAKLVKDLTAVQDKLTKAGNLEEALRVRDAIAAAKDPSRATAKPGASGGGGAGADNVMAADAIQLGKALAGSRWRKVAGPHKGFSITFKPDMSLTTDHHSMSGTWAPVAKDRVRISIQSSSCTSELLAVGPDGRVMLNADGQPDFEYLGR